MHCFSLPVGTHLYSPPPLILKYLQVHICSIASYPPLHNNYFYFLRKFMLFGSKLIGLFKKKSEKIAYIQERKD